MQEAPWIGRCAGRYPHPLSRPATNAAQRHACGVRGRHILPHIAAEIGASRRCPRATTASRSPRHIRWRATLVRGLLFQRDMHGRRRGPQRGFSILELLIVAAIVSIVAGAAIPRRQEGLFALHNAQSALVADMRMTRSSAIAQGVHFRLEIADSRNYTIHRMIDGGGGWVEDGDPVVERELPPTVAFSGGVGEGYEFNTRGFLVDPTVLQTLTLVDSATGGYRTVDVWPSGQVISR